MADSADTRNERPDGSAWPEAQRKVAARNEEVRKAARQKGDADDRELAKRRAERERGKNVYR